MTIEDPATGGRAVLVLDFDGVICDSWRECALVTWAGHHRWPAPEFGPSAFDALPAGFVARFLALRGFARHLGHFAVALQDGSEQVRTQADFDRRYARLPPAAVTEFVARASRYRCAARAAQRERWLAFHDLYKGVQDLLLELQGRLYVATARDSTSVRELLSSCGVAIPPDRVYGQQQSKLGALTEIGAREDARAGSIFFIDDSLSNVVAARDAGYTAAWALWGYSAPEHDKEASRLGVPRLTLADLPSTALSAAGRWPLAAAAWPQQPGRIAAAGEPATVDGGAG